MITAYFEWKRLHIDISQIDRKYKENWKEIKFSLFYGAECTMSDWLDNYTKVVEKTIVYSWQDKIILDLDKIKEWYRWQSIFIWYYIEVNFWRKFLLFKDSKEINISWRENELFYHKNLPNNNKYFNISDTYSYKMILKSLFNEASKKEKVVYYILILWFIITLIVSLFTFNFEFLSIAFFPVFLFFIFLYFSSTWYFFWKIHTDNLNSNLLWDIVSWNFRRNLTEVTIQFFATNSEKWEYEEDDWSTIRLVKFNKVVWNILLFEKIFQNIKKDIDIKTLLWNEKIDLDLIYSKLYPEISISEDWWLALNLELKVISNNYKDISIKKEIHLDKNKFILSNNKIENNDNNFNSDFFE